MSTEKWNKRNYKMYSCICAIFFDKKYWLFWELWYNNIRCQRDWQQVITPSNKSSKKIILKKIKKVLDRRLKIWYNKRVVTETTEICTLKNEQCRVLVKHRKDATETIKTFLYMTEIRIKFNNENEAKSELVKELTNFRIYAERFI